LKIDQSPVGSSAGLSFLVAFAPPIPEGGLALRAGLGAAISESRVLLQLIAPSFVFYLTNHSMNSEGSLRCVREYAISSDVTKYYIFVLTILS
jgi:hypothetical protein